MKEAKVTISVKIYEDSTILVNEPPKALTVGLENIDEYLGAKFIKLASSDTDIEEDFSSVDAGDLLYILTNQDISVKLNASTNDPITIKARENADGLKYGVLCLTSASITKIFLTNTSGNTAEVKIIAASVS